MNDDIFHDIVLIWLLRRLDISEAKREVNREYQDLCENCDVFMLSRDELIVHMLDILDKYALLPAIHGENNFNFNAR
jgi:hypothetical protein